MVAGRTKRRRRAKAAGLCLLSIFLVCGAMGFLAARPAYTDEYRFLQRHIPAEVFVGRGFQPSGLEERVYRWRAAASAVRAAANAELLAAGYRIRRDRPDDAEWTTDDRMVVLYSGNDDPAGQTKRTWVTVRCASVLPENLWTAWRLLVAELSKRIAGRDYPR